MDIGRKKIVMGGHTLTDLLMAIDYCDKAVKTDDFNSEIRQAFYRKKKALLYHLMRSRDELGIAINDYHIDLRENPFKDGFIEMYAFSLCHDGFVLRVHQRKTARLEGLFEWNGVRFNERGKYVHDNNDAKYDKMKWDEYIEVIDRFYEGWRLNEYLDDLSKDVANYKLLYNSYVYFYPYFDFWLMPNKSIVGNKTIVRIKHCKSGRAYRMTLKSLKKHGEISLCAWRKSDKRFNWCV